MELTYKSTLEPIKAFVDADWGGCAEDRKSYTGYIFLLYGGPIAWGARKQRTVALSTTEAEYMAMSVCLKEAVYLQRFLRELGFKESADLVVFCDHRNSMKLTENPTFHSKCKHIDIRHHFVRGIIKSEEVTLSYVSTEEQIADFLTEGLPRAKHTWYIESSGHDVVC